VVSGSGTALASGTTDDTGQCRLVLAHGGQDHIVITSEFIKDVPIDIQDEPGSDADVTILAPMSSGTIPAPN
jgi:hypothetical protein